MITRLVPKSYNPARKFANLRPRTGKSHHRSAPDTTDAAPGNRFMHSERLGKGAPCGRTIAGGRPTLKTMKTAVRTWKEGERQRSVLRSGGLVLYCRRNEEQDMATSSITANFAIRDEKEAKAFIAALLSDTRPTPPPARTRTWGFAGSVAEIERRRPRKRTK